MRTFGEKLRALREQKKLTQTDLAKKMGMKTYTTVSKWESNENMPKGKDLKFLAEFFNVSSDYLLGVNIENKKSHDISFIYNDLEASRQQKVYKYAEKQLQEQNSLVKFKPTEEVKNRDIIHTLAAHSEDPDRAYTKEEIDHIESALDKARKKYEEKNSE